MEDLVTGDGDATIDRKRAVLAVLPFFLIGVGNLLLILLWGMDGLWGFLIMPPILFISVLAYVAFRTGFVRDRTGDAAPEPDGE